VPHSGEKQTSPKTAKPLIWPSIRLPPLQIPTNPWKPPWRRAAANNDDKPQHLRQRPTRTTTVCSNQTRSYTSKKRKIDCDCIKKNNKQHDEDNDDDEPQQTTTTSRSTNDDEPQGRRLYAAIKQEVTPARRERLIATASRKTINNTTKTTTTTSRCKQRRQAAAPTTTSRKDDDCMQQSNKKLQQQEEKNWLGLHQQKQYTTRRRAAAPTTTSHSCTMGINFAAANKFLPWKKRIKAWIIVESAACLGRMLVLHSCYIAVLLGPKSRGPHSVKNYIVHKFESFLHLWFPFTYHTTNSTAVICWSKCGYSLSGVGAAFALRSTLLYRWGRYHQHRVIVREKQLNNKRNNYTLKWIMKLVSTKNGGWPSQTSFFNLCKKSLPR
jgi:hypothetical protein